MTLPPISLLPTLESQTVGRIRRISRAERSGAERNAPDEGQSPNGAIRYAIASYNDSVKWP
jgi:hypothetical protein